MRVVLTADVPGVGRASDIVQVKPGYFRNFLCPRGFAQPATPAVVAAQVRSQTARERQRLGRETEQAATLAALEGATIRTAERARNDKLFGSVTADRIRRLLREQLRVDVPAAAIKLPHPLRTVGQHPVSIRLGTSQAVITVEVQNG